MLGAVSVVLLGRDLFARSEPIDIEPRFASGFMKTTVKGNLQMGDPVCLDGHGQLHRWQGIDGDRAIGRAMTGGGKGDIVKVRIFCPPN
jgi:hypothetical protein